MCLKATTNTLTKDYSARRLFTSTTSCHALNSTKSVPSKRSRATKSLLGAPKTPGTAKPKPQKTVTTYSEYGKDIYSSLARATLPPEPDVEPEEVTPSIQESNADIVETKKSDEKQAKSDEPTVAAKLESAPGNPNKKSSQIKADGLTVASSPDTSSADNVRDRPVRLAKRASRRKKPTRTLSKHGLNGPTSSSVALVAVSCVEDRPIHLEEPSALALWMSKFRRLTKDVDRFNRKQKLIREQYNSTKLSIKVNRQRLRLRELERFQASLQLMMGCAVERQRHRGVLLLRFKSVHSGLLSIGLDLRELHSDTGKPIYDEYLKLIWTDRHNSQIDSHNWRHILQLRLKTYGPLATSHDGWWIYNQVETQSAIWKSCMEVARDIRAISNDIRQAGSEAGLSSTTLTLIKRSSKANESMINCLTTESRESLHKQTYNQFFLSKPKNNIHWKQLNFYAPFISSMASYYRVKVVAGEVFRRFDDLLKARPAQISWERERWKPLFTGFIFLHQNMFEIEMLRDELFEINWIRLKLEKLTKGRQTTADLSMRNPLSLSPCRFEKWVDYVCDFQSATRWTDKKKEKRLSSMEPGQSAYSAGVNTEDQLKSESHEILPFQPAHASSPYPSYWSHKLSSATNGESQKPEEIESGMVGLFDEEDQVPETFNEHSNGKDTKKTRSRAADRRKARLLSPKSSRNKPTRQTQKRVSHRPPTTTYYSLKMS